MLDKIVAKITSLLNFKLVNDFSLRCAVGVYLAAAVFTILLAELVYKTLKLPEKYTQMIVGSITWGDSSKFRDYVVLFTLVFGFLFFLVIVRALLYYLVRKIKDERICEQFSDFILLLCTPLALWLSGLLVTQNITTWAIKLTGCLLLNFFIFSFILIKRDRTFNLNNSQNFFHTMHGIFLAILALLFAVVAGIVGVNRIAGVVHIEVGHWLNAGSAIKLISTAVVIVIITIILMVSLVRSLDSLNKFLRRSIVLSQGVFPLYFLLLIPTPWLVGGKLTIGYHLNTCAWVVIGLMMVFAYADLYRRYNLIKNNSANIKYLGLFSSVCIIGILLFLKCSPITLPDIIPDDYHFGEFLTPWFGLSQYQLIPFWDYEPARGMMNYCQGFFANLFFDGKASSLSATNPFYYAFLLLAVLPVLRWSVGLGVAVLALFLAPFINSVSEIDILFTAFVCLSCKSFLVWRPIKWLIIWPLMCVLALLYAPGQAALVIAALSPLFFVMLYKAYKENQRQVYYLLFFSSLIGVILCFITPLGKMLFGAFRYGLEQSSVNSIANGIPWDKAMVPIDRSNQWILEFTRFSFIAVAIWSGVLILEAAWGKLSDIRKTILTYAVPLFILTTIFIIRAAGRIDACVGSRQGMASIWALSLLLPLLLFATSRYKQIGRSVFVWVFLCGMVYPFFCTGFMSNFSAAFEPIVADGFNKFTDGSSGGIAKMGYTTNKKHLDRLGKINKVLNIALDKNETYLDMSGHGADYFYLNRRQPIQIAAVYNLITEQQQLRAITSLKKQDIPVILLSAENINHDGGPASLRANLLYRYILLQTNYKIAKIDDYIWLIREDRIDRFSDQDRVVITDLGDDVVNNSINEVYNCHDLQMIPRAWGNSYSSLAKKMHLAYHIPDNLIIVDHGAACLDFNLAQLNLRGGDVGVLSFNFICNDASFEPSFKVYWTTDKNKIENELMSVKFVGKSGYFMIPIDSIPAWLLAKQVMSIRIEVVNKDLCGSFKIKNINLFRRYGANYLQNN